MFASIIVDQIIYQRLDDAPAVTDLVGGNIYGLPRVPQTGDVPALLYYMESSRYGEFPVLPTSDDLNYETVRYVIKVACEGTSTVPIEEAAVEQQELFAGLTVGADYRGRHYELSFTILGEIPNTTVEDGEKIYRQLGNVYDIEVVRT
jgi:hypothetical protein